MSPKGLSSSLLLALDELRGLSPAMLVQRLALLSVYTVGVIITFFVIRTIYNIWFHPLAKYPGDWLAKSTNAVFYYKQATGQVDQWVYEQHLKHGTKVRVGPGRLSFAEGQGWKDIYGHRVGGKKAFIKDPWFYHSRHAFNGGHDSLLTSIEDAGHSRLRKIFSNAFSDRALREQEPLLLRYVDRLIEKIRVQNEAQPDTKVDFVKLYNFTTFDIMSDLAFGEPLGMLENGEYVPWVANVFDAVRFLAAASCINRFPWLTRAIAAVAPNSMLEGFEKHAQFTRERVDKRLAKGNDEPDIWTLVMKYGEKQGANGGLTRGEMDTNAELFMTAGTETTATLLSGLTYLLLCNPDKFDKVKKEIRALSEDEMHIDRLAQLKYMHACFEEAFRIYPSVPAGLPRVTPEGGASVCGEFIPEGTRVGLHQFAAYHLECNFQDPWKFVPERWLPGSPYDKDRKEVLQPFSTGPRNCIGKNLAYHEMRLIFAKVIKNFDLELCPESANWTKQKTFILWEKPELLIKVRPAKHD